MVRILPAYAALLAFIFLALSARVIGLRRAAKVAIGSAGDKALERGMRVHANFAEYAPLALVLLLLLELRGAWPALIHLLAAALVAGRALHAYGVSQEKEDFRLRIAGMMPTLGVIGATAAALLVLTVL